MDRARRIVRGTVDEISQIVIKSCDGFHRDTMIRSQFLFMVQAVSRELKRFIVHPLP